MKILRDILNKSGNIITFSIQDSETNKLEHETLVFKYDATIIVYEDLYEYYRDREIEEGKLAMFIASESDSYDTIKITMDKSTIAFFAGDDFEKVKRKLKPFLAKKKNIKDKTLKVIDFEIHGNQMKLYLGDKNCTNYWGDDWDDKPYECNAGIVYDRFVKDTAVINFLNDELVEIKDGYYNSPFCKEDFKNGEPFAYLRNDEVQEYSYHKIKRNNIFNEDRIKKFYFNASIKEFYNQGYLITD